MIQDAASAATGPTRTQRDAATAAVDQARPYEQAAINAMPPERQQQYANVRGLVQGDAVATAGLQSLLLHGQLLGGRDFRNQENLLGHLSGIAAPGRSFAAGLNAETLSRGLVKELANPAGIDQGPRGTCVPTAMLSDVARRNPAEYARIASGLSTPGGTVQLAGGMFLQRSQGTESPDQTGRTMAQRLMGPALMEVANEDRVYHDGFSSTDEDAPRGPDGQPLDDGAGAYDSGVWLALRQLYGRQAPVDFVQAGEDGSNGDALMRMVNSVTPDRPVFAGIDTGSGGHEVLILPPSREGNPAESGEAKVRYQNPWGQVEEMSADEFRRRAHFVSSVDMPQAQRAVPTTTQEQPFHWWRVGPF